MKHQITNYENAAREREMLMVDKPKGSMAVVIIVMMVAIPVGAGLVGWLVAWVLGKI